MYHYTTTLVVDILTTLVISGLSRVAAADFASQRRLSLLQRFSKLERRRVFHAFVL